MILATVFWIVVMAHPCSIFINSGECWSPRFDMPHFATKRACRHWLDANWQDPSEPRITRQTYDCVPYSKEEP
jgi:hypothetical protein